MALRTIRAKWSAAYLLKLAAFQGAQQDQGVLQPWIQVEVLAFRQGLAEVHRLAVACQVAYQEFLLWQPREKKTVVKIFAINAASYESKRSHNKDLHQQEN